MAVLIASSLRKELSGDVLFDGVSFKVERRDRLALAGPNGAGKTTLLRALAGEISLEGGELAWEKGTRIALHDQRPPSESDRPAPRLRPAGHRRPRSRRRGAADARAGDGRRRPCRGDAAPVLVGAGSPRARRRLRLARPRGLGRARARLHRRRSRPSAPHVLRRRADPRVARARTRLAAGHPAARRADEPSRHRVARVARGDAEDDRRGRHPRRARPLVPRGGHDRRARARQRPLDLLPGRLACLAPRAGGARAPPGEDRRAPGRAARAPRAFRRAVPREGEQGEAGAVEVKQIKRLESQRVQAPDGAAARSASSS